MVVKYCNPCACLKGQIHQNPTPCPPDNPCCLKACNGLITCENGGVGPCGQSGVMNLNDLNHTTDGCSGNLIFRKAKENFYDQDIFASVSITTAGVLTWVTKGPETVGKYGEIHFKIICASDCEDCFELRSNGILRIGVKDECLANTCEEGQVCNPCDGACNNVDVSITVGSLNQNSNITTNV